MTPALGGGELGLIVCGVPSNLQILWFVAWLSNYLLSAYYAPGTV